MGLGGFSSLGFQFHPLDTELHSLTDYFFNLSLQLGQG